MAYNFSPFETKLRETSEWLKGELMNIQTGRATPAILDGVKVDSYGAKVPINQVGSVAVEDARTLRVSAWDKDSIRNIEVAIRDADLGLGVSVDDQGLRVVFPELTTETREKYIKVVGKKVEEARISVRKERDEVWNDIQKMEKDGEIGKDEKFKLKEKMEELTKKGNGELDQLAARKEKELLG